MIVNRLIIHSGLKQQFIKNRYLGMISVADPGISGGGDINPAGGLGGAESPPVGSRGEAPGHQTKCNCTLNLFYYH